MAMVDGTTAVDEHHLHAALHQMADFLLRLHDLDVETLDLTQPPRGEDPVRGALEYTPDSGSHAALPARNFAVTACLTL